MLLMLGGRNTGCWDAHSLLLQQLQIRPFRVDNDIGVERKGVDEYVGRGTFLRTQYWLRSPNVLAGESAANDVCC